MGKVIVQSTLISNQFTGEDLAHGVYQFVQFVCMAAQLRLPCDVKLLPCVEEWKNNSVAVTTEDLIAYNKEVEAEQTEQGLQDEDSDATDDLNAAKRDRTQSGGEQPITQPSEAQLLARQNLQKILK